MSLLSHLFWLLQKIESSLTGLSQWDVAQNSLLYKAVWYTHFSGILSVKGPNSNRSRYAHLWRAASVRGSSISCHTVAVPIMLKKVMQILKVLRYNKPRSVSQQWHMLPYFPAPNLLCLLQYIPLEVNLVYQIIKINSIFWRAEPPNDLNAPAQFLNEFLSKSSPSPHVEFSVPEVMNLDNYITVFLLSEWMVGPCVGNEYLLGRGGITTHIINVSCRQRRVFEFKFWKICLPNRYITHSTLVKNNLKHDIFVL
jgi:hypothetical protein